MNFVNRLNKIEALLGTDEEESFTFISFDLICPEEKCKSRKKQIADIRRHGIKKGVLVLYCDLCEFKEECSENVEQK